MGLARSPCEAIPAPQRSDLGPGGRGPDSPGILAATRSLLLAGPGQGLIDRLLDGGPEVGIQIGERQGMVQGGNRFLGTETPQGLRGTQAVPGGASGVQKGLAEYPQLVLGLGMYRRAVRNYRDQAVWQLPYDRDMVRAPDTSIIATAKPSYLLPMTGRSGHRP